MIKKGGCEGFLFLFSMSLFVKMHGLTILEAHTCCLQARGARTLVRKAALLGDGTVTQVLTPRLTNATGVYSPADCPCAEASWGTQSWGRTAKSGAYQLDRVDEHWSYVSHPIRYCINHLKNSTQSLYCYCSCNSYPKVSLTKAMLLWSSLKLKYQFLLKCLTQGQWHSLWQPDTVTAIWALSSSVRL